jgi:hypothetical protein
MYRSFPSGMSAQGYAAQDRDMRPADQPREAFKEHHKDQRSERFYRKTIALH